MLLKKKTRKALFKDFSIKIIFLDITIVIEKKGKILFFFYKIKKIIYYLFPIILLDIINWVIKGIYNWKELSDFISYLIIILKNIQ